MFILQYKASFTYDRPVRCFRFVYIYVCIAVFLYGRQFCRVEVGQAVLIGHKVLMYMAIMDSRRRGR